MSLLCILFDMPKDEMLQQEWVANELFDAVHETTRGKITPQQLFPTGYKKIFVYYIMASASGNYSRSVQKQRCACMKKTFYQTSIFEKGKLYSFNVQHLPFPPRRHFCTRPSSSGCIIFGYTAKLVWTLIIRMIRSHRTTTCILVSPSDTCTHFQLVVNCWFELVVWDSKGALKQQSLSQGEPRNPNLGIPILIRQALC